jgi:uncharacterized iron-regulated membrane protein
VNDILVTLAAIAAAIGIAAAITIWQIRRVQYPPELRWPDERKRRRRHQRSKRNAP